MSIGPSLTARDRTARTAPETDKTAGSAADSESDSFALRYAKWTFDPFNTHPCPEMFTDKWTAGD